MRKISHRLSALCMTLSAFVFTPSAQALDFVLTDTTPGGMTAAQLAAFHAAADLWKGRITDNVTVYLNISFGVLGDGILGSTGSNYVLPDYTTVRSALLADAKSGLDASATANLQNSATLSFYSTNMDGSSRFNNDTTCLASSGPCDVDNRYLAVTTANAKALGLSTTTSIDNPDGTIGFNSQYASQFQFDRNGGIGANLIDFIAVAQHEIGHALGFVSGVDDVDYCMHPGNEPNYCSLNGPQGLEQYVVYSPLDLFRYSSKGALDMRVGGSPYFSVDGGASQIESFATGTYNGDGWQASHFTPDAANLMRPYLGRGYIQNATEADWAAMDAIGWDVTTPVPEPETYAMMLAGLGAVGWAARRRRERAAA